MCSIFDGMYVVIPLVVSCERRLHNSSPYLGLRECIVEYFMRYFVWDRFGSKSLTLWLQFILILFLLLRMLARGLIISRRFVQVRTAPKHRSTHISNYQSSEHKSNQHDESDQMKFPCTLKNVLLTIRDCFGLFFASKGLGYLAKLLLPLLLLACYKLSCYQSTRLLTVSALADITLLKTTCHFLLLLIVFDTLTYPKE